MNEKTVEESRPLITKILLKWRPSSLPDHAKPILSSGTPTAPIQSSQLPNSNTGTPKAEDTPQQETDDQASGSSPSQRNGDGTKIESETQIRPPITEQNV